MARTGWIFGVLLLEVASAAVVGVAVQNANGTYTYSYTIDNTGGQFAISAWSLEFDIPPGLVDFEQHDVLGGGSVVVPSSDWFAWATPFPVVGDSGQDVLNLFGAPVAVDTTLSGFSFTSAFPPSDMVLYAEFSSEGQSATGSAVGPTLPGTLPHLVILGLASPTELSVEVFDIPPAMTFHLRSSTDLQEFVPLEPPVNIDAGTAFPLTILVDQRADPSRFFKLFIGPSPPAQP